MIDLLYGWAGWEHVAPMAVQTRFEDRFASLLTCISPFQLGPHDLDGAHGSGLRASSCLPRPPLKDTRTGRPGSGPAKSSSDYRAELAGSVEDRPSRRYLPGSRCFSRAPASG